MLLFLSPFFWISLLLSVLLAAISITKTLPARRSQLGGHTFLFVQNPILRQEWVVLQPLFGRYLSARLSWWVKRLKFNPREPTSQETWVPIQAEAMRHRREGHLVKELGRSCLRWINGLDVTARKSSSPKTWEPMHVGAKRCNCEDVRLRMAHTCYFFDFLH